MLAHNDLTIASDELIVDLFAGGGGASTGIERALGRPVDIAVNHSATAIAMHERNHPHTRHFQEDVWRVDPRTVCEGRPVGLLWTSPACTHFSRAKGGQNPKSARIRSLASVVIRWARDVRPRVIFLENVEEFEDWGPLDEDGKPIKHKAGRSFRVWLGKLRAQGYDVEWRSLVAADYGTPTTRKRLYLIARCDGQRIVWPEPTHGKGRAYSWRTAAECIDWTIPCPSIFGRKKPLAEATLRRIAAGVMRFVVNNPRPFIVPVKSWGGGGNDARAGDDPLRTVTASKRGEFAVVAPAIVGAGGPEYSGKPTTIAAPIGTITTENHRALIDPSLVQVGYGEREGQRPRSLDVEQPLGTVVAGGAKHAAVAAFLTKHFGGVVGQKIDGPASTVTAKDHHALTTVTLGHTDRRDEVRAFLLKYYGTEKNAATQRQSVTDPLHTITTKARFGLVVVEGVEYEIADIGMRMLDASELWRAQGFDSPNVTGLTKTAQVELCGNSVCPPVAEAIVRANFTRSARARRVA